MRRPHVFFDFGGTLARVPPPLDRPGRVWARICQEFGVEVPDRSIQDALDAVGREQGRRIYDFLGRTDAFWHLYDARVMDQLGIRERRAEIEHALQSIFDDPSRVELYPETRRVLADLRARGYRLGVISNHHDGLRKVLRHHALERFFETVTYSQEAGTEKPDPAVFTLALDRAGCSPSAAVHVGDSLNMDVAGARQVGMGVVWVNREDLPEVPGLFTVRTLDDLRAVLERLDPPGPV